MPEHLMTDDSEWFDSYTALRDLPFGDCILWLDSLMDVAVDEKSTQAEQRAAQRAYDFASVAVTALRQLQDVMRDEVVSDMDSPEARRAAGLEPIRPAPGKAHLPPLSAYIERVAKQHPHLNPGMTKGLAVQARARGKSLKDMPVRKPEPAKPAKRKVGRPRKNAK